VSMLEAAGFVREFGGMLFVAPLIEQQASSRSSIPHRGRAQRRGQLDANIV
jgi:hypothetical protein